MSLEFLVLHGEQVSRLLTNIMFFSCLCTTSEHGGCGERDMGGTVRRRHGGEGTYFVLTFTLLCTVVLSAVRLPKSTIQTAA